MSGRRTKAGPSAYCRGHADFLTVLETSVVTWRDTSGAEHHVAVRGGMLEVRDGHLVTIATREAVAGDDLAILRTDVIDVMKRRAESERNARVDAQRLYLAAIQRIRRLFAANGTPAIPGGPGARGYDVPES